MLMKQKSLEFIEGYVFGRIEKKVIQAYMDQNNKEFTIRISVPKIWFGLPTSNIKSASNFIPELVVSKLKVDLKETLNCCNNDRRGYEYDIRISPDAQYVKFDIRGTRIEPVVELTVSELEHILGYKVRIVADQGGK